MPGTDKVSFYRGEDVQLDFTMAPVVDVSGWTILFTVEGGPETPKLIQVACSIEDGPAGEFRATLDDGSTLTGTDKTPGIYRYDAYRTDAGSERVVAIGECEVLATARFPE